HDVAIHHPPPFGLGRDNDALKLVGITIRGIIARLDFDLGDAKSGRFMKLLNKPRIKRFVFSP
ncbi:MAG: hypothetical protein ACO3C0_08270, partial [Burkholderiaceae bacterium]